MDFISKVLSQFDDNNPRTVTQLYEIFLSEREERETREKEKKKIRGALSQLKKQSKITQTSKGTYIKNNH